MYRLISLIFGFLALREPNILLSIILVLLSVFGRSAYRWLWSVIVVSCVMYWTFPSVFGAFGQIIIAYTVDWPLEMLANKQFSIDALVDERAVRFTVLHCAIPEPQTLEPSIWAWLVSYVLPLPSPEPMQEICMPTWSYSIYSGTLLACVLLLGFLIFCGLYYLCRQGVKLANAAIEDTQSLVVNGVGCALMV